MNLTLEQAKQVLKDEGIDLPDGITLEELLPYLNKDTRQIKRGVSGLDEPQWIELTKTCTRCGSKFIGKQKYYIGYEGNWLDKEMSCCYFCIIRNFENLKLQMLQSYSFDLEEVETEARWTEFL